MGGLVGCLLLALCSVATAYQLNPQVVRQQIAQCNQLLDQSGAVATCLNIVGTNWNCVNSGEYQGAGPLRDRLTLSCGNSDALYCCPLWAMVKCLLQQARDICGPVLAPEKGLVGFMRAFRHWQFQPQIVQLNEAHCTAFQFGSLECNNVFLYIRNRQLLEPIARQYGLYQYFFSDTVYSNRSSLLNFTRNRVAHQDQSSSVLQPEQEQYLWLFIALGAFSLCAFVSILRRRP